ncbi:hypothetical protein [Mycolicibacterium sp. XJ1904]
MTANSATPPSSHFQALPRFFGGGPAGHCCCHGGCCGGGPYGAE